MTTAESHQIRPTRAEIDVGALVHNFGEAARLAQPAAVLGVVKANAYGHGAVLVCRALVAAGAQRFAVALVEEGLELRAAGISGQIIVVGGAYEGGYRALVEADLEPVIFRAEHLDGLSEAATALHAAARAHLKVDTGMGRIGVRTEELDAFLRRARAVTNVEFVGIASHFANADLADPSFTQDQIAVFKDAVSRMRELGFNPKYRHLANSAGVLELPEVRDGELLNLARPGLMLYGVAPAGWLAAKATLRPVLRLRTAITHLKRIPAGTPVSYGGTWKAPHDAVIATLPIGYADGYSRRNSNVGEVLVRGRRATIAGRVCMDMCMVDVTHIPEVTVGDEVVLLGKQGLEEITADEVAQRTGTISYEVLCGIGARVPRVAIEAG